MNGEDQGRISNCLHAGEELLWSGRPAMQWWDDRNALWIGLGFLTLVLVAAFTLADPNTWAYFPEFLICMVLFGFVGVVWLPLARWRRKRHTVYALTNERAIVLSRSGVKSYPLKPYMVLEYESAGRGGTGRLLFACKEFLCYPVRSAKDGFWNLPDAEAPLEVLRSRFRGQVFAEHKPAREREAAERELALHVTRHPLRACARLAVDVAFVFIAGELMYRSIIRSGSMGGSVDIGGIATAFVLICYACHITWWHARVFLLGCRLRRASARSSS